MKKKFTFDIARTSPDFASRTTLFTTFLAPRKVLRLLNLLLDVELDVVVESQFDRRTIDRVMLAAIAAGDDHAVRAGRCPGMSQPGREHRPTRSSRSSKAPVSTCIDAVDDVALCAIGVLVQIRASGADLGEFLQMARPKGREQCTARYRRSTAGEPSAGRGIGLVVQLGREVLGDLREPLVRVGRR